MFERIKKAFHRPAGHHVDNPSSHLPHAPVSEWAASRGMSFSGGAFGNTMSMQGKVGDRNWRMELGRPSRDYVAGEELRARAELGVYDDVGAMIINRPLKDVLERRAYSMITDTLQTTVDPRLPEEMRWLAMYDEIGWEGAPAGFWDRYAVLSNKRENAVAWVDDALMSLLMHWPDPRPLPTVPFMIVLQRSKCYLRMQFMPAGTPTLDHASDVFVAACSSALDAFHK
jgi:hypothetical protein